MPSTVTLSLIAAVAVAVFVYTFRYGYLPQRDEMHELVRHGLSMVLDTVRVWLFIVFVTVLIVMPVLILVDLGTDDDEPYVRRNPAEVPSFPEREGRAHPCEAPGSTVFSLC